MSALTFNDDEQEWLTIQMKSPDVQRILETNPARILETDESGKPTKVKQGRLEGDGALKTVASLLTRLYLQRFNVPFTAESPAVFEARKAACARVGLTHRHARKGETEEQFKDRTDETQLRKRVYTWVRSHSPNKVQKSTKIKITSSSASPAPYTPYSAFRLSTTPVGSSSTSPTPGPSSSGGIGEWSSALHQSFINQTPEAHQELQEKADMLNDVMHTSVSEDMQSHIREEKSKLLPGHARAQLHTWALQTGFLGFIVMGGPIGGQVETFSLNNAFSPGGESFSQRMCRRFKITEQQWQTEVDAYFQDVFNPASADQPGNPMGTKQELPVDPLDNTQLPFTLANILSATPPSSVAVEGTDSAVLSANVDEAVAAFVSLSDIYPESESQSIIGEELSAEIIDLVHPTPGLVPTSAAISTTLPTPSQLTLPIPSQPVPETSTRGLVSSGAHGEGASTSKRKGDGGDPPKKRSRRLDTVTKAAAPSTEDLPKSDETHPVGLVSRRSGRKIIPKVSGTAAYDEVVGRQQAARHRK